MKLLSLDTSTDACSVALRINNEMRMDYRIAPRQHTDIILDMIDGLLQESGTLLADLDCLAFGRGPGAFTGLRIAAGVVQGIAYGADLPVVPVSSLAALAQAASDKHDVSDVLAVMDARMQEVYVGRYKSVNGLMQCQGEEVVVAPDQVCVDDAGIFGAGNGFAHYVDELKTRTMASLSGIDETLLPDAASVAKLAAEAFRQGHAVKAEQAIPVYIRNNVAVKPSKNSIV